LVDRWIKDLIQKKNEKTIWEKKGGRNAVILRKAGEG